MRRPLKSLIFSFVLLFANTALAENIETKINNVIKPYVDYEVFQGAVLVAKEGRIVYQQGHGLANQEWNIPNSPEAKFQIASMTKSFTAALVLKLVEQDKLALSDTLGKYFPELFPQSAKDKAGITLSQLLDHSSGLPRAFTIPGWFTGRFNARISEQEYAEIIANQPLLFTPGTSWHYTNLGYFLMGLIIESATGKPYEQVLREQVFTPLNMTDSGIINDNVILKNKASNYRVAKEGGYERPGYINIRMFGASASMYTTVQDLFKLDQALYTNQLLSDKNKALLFGTEQHYGWHVDKEKPNVIMTAGELMGYSSLMVRYVDKKNTIIVLSNNGISSVAKVRLAEDIAAVFKAEPVDYKPLPISFMLTRALVKGNLQRNIDNYQKHSQLYSYDESSLIALGNQQMWTKKLDNAIAIFKFTTSLFADSARSHSKLGDVHVQNNQPKQALASYQQALKLTPDDTQLMGKIKGVSGE
jgi:CubicO group peptidase (beta-lactamase class C family)